MADQTLPRGRSVALAPLEAAYRAVNRVRRSLYRRGVLRPERLPRPVISIGNRAIGGSGKTPTVVAVAEGLLERGLRPAVLTRGYGRASVEEPLRVHGPDAARFGDEPVLIAAALPDVPVIVGSRRARAARWFLERGECDVFLLDDGFQHLQLGREVDVVIEASGARWFREGRGALRDADVVLLRDDARAPEGVSSFRAELRPSAWLLEGEERDLAALRGMTAVAFAALANNDQFFAMVSSLGVELRERIAFPDHHRYGAADLERVERARSRSGAFLVLTTEKDLVKLPGAPFAALRVRMEIEPREEFLSLLSASIRS